MSDITHLVIATHNPGKLVEFKALLADHIPHITSAGELGLTAPEETGRTFVENALIKARTVCQQSGHIAMADDSGICIAALNGLPGVDTADWVKNGGLASLEELLKSGVDPAAKAVCVLALVYPDGREELFEGEVPGTIVWPPRGTGGFGYDASFQPATELQTYAEMGKAKKNTLSHRALAFSRLMTAKFPPDSPLMVPVGGEM